MNKRGLLLALGAKIADLEPDQEVELAKAAVVVIAGGLPFHIESFEVDTAQEMIDITSFGDSSRQFIRGRRTDYFRIKGLLEPSQDVAIASLPGRVFTFEADYGSSHLKAEIVIDSVLHSSNIGELCGIDVTAKAIAPPVITLKLKKLPPEPLPFRAMKL